MFLGSNRVFKNRSKSSRLALKSGRIVFLRNIRDPACQRHTGQTLFVYSDGAMSAMLTLRPSCCVFLFVGWSFCVVGEDIVGCWLGLIASGFSCLLITGLTLSV